MTSFRCAQLELEADAIQVLTRAAHQTAQATSGHDFAGFLARVLASTAANVGGPRQLRTGPPDSRAGRNVDALLRGVVGDDLDEWLPHRTQPVLITVNVAEIVEGGLHPELLRLSAAIDTIVDRYAPMREATALHAQTAGISAIAARYHDEYRSHADRFAAAAVEHGLRAGVQVTADTNPSSAWRSQTAVTNPRDGAGDQVAYALWNLAHDAVPPPHVSLADAPASDLHHVSRGV